MSNGGGNMERVLRLMAEKNASDVYLSANTPILIKINGQILQLSDQILSTNQTRQLLAEMLPPMPMHRPSPTIEPAVTMVTVKVEEWDDGPVVARSQPTAIYRPRRVTRHIPWQWRLIVAGIRLTRIVHKSAKQQMKQFNKLQRQMIRRVLPRHKAMRGARAR